MNSCDLCLTDGASVESMTNYMKQDGYLLCPSKTTLSATTDIRQLYDTGSWQVWKKFMPARDSTGSRTLPAISVIVSDKPSQRITDCLQRIGAKGFDFKVLKISDANEKILSDLTSNVVVMASLDMNLFDGASPNDAKNFGLCRDLLSSNNRKLLWLLQVCFHHVSTLILAKVEVAIAFMNCESL